MEEADNVTAGNEIVKPKRTKKEKRRERKALAAAEAEQSSRSCLLQNEGPAADPIAGGLRVFVGHLPQSTTEAELRTRFEACGEITDVVMLCRHGSQRFKGQAFVTFSRKAQATRALDLHDSAWGAGSDKRMTVARALARSSPDSKADAAAPPTEVGASSVKKTASCFVGNLPAAATAKEVRATFRHICGPSTIRKVRLLPSVGDTRRAFVDFASAAAAATAAGRNGADALGRMLVVSLSRRAEAPSGGGRRSQDARIRRRLKREETQPAAKSNGRTREGGTSKGSRGVTPVLNLGQ